MSLVRSPIDTHAAESSVVLHVYVGTDRRRRLRTDILSAVRIANSNDDLDALERQSIVREMAREIAVDGFGQMLIAKARRQLVDGGIVVWDGLPEGDDVEQVEPGMMTFGQGMAAVLAQGLTTSIGYRQEDGGRHFQRLFPVPGMVDSGKTPGELLPHLDNAFLRPWAQPEVIHLVCRNNDAETPTLLFTMPAVLRSLREGYSERVIEMLQQDAFVTSISNSFVASADDKRITTRVRPVLYRPSGARAADPTHFLAKSYDVAVPETVEGAEDFRHALDAYQTVLKERQAAIGLPIVARPGQAISFHQQRLLHGRAAIGSSKYREMVRAYGRFDLQLLLRSLRRVPANWILDAWQLVDRD